MDVYFISGLGADKRAFHYLKLDARINVIHLDWIKVKDNESLQAYSERLSKKIDSNSPFCLVGLSFGGIVANEISKIITAERIVFISSVKNRSELPWYFRCFGSLKLHKLIPIKTLFSKRNWVHLFFGAKSEKEKEILNELIKNADPAFIKWAIDKIVNWENEDLPEKYLHLHGSKDLIFPLSNIQDCKEIVGGTHLLVLKKYRTVSDAINSYLLE